MTAPFPSLRLRIVLMAYSALMWLLLPVIVIYLWRRGRKDPAYVSDLAERFGRYGETTKGAVWVHAVSLGEMRSATPLIRALLDRGERVITTHFTPAGRREAIREFAAEIAAGQLRPVWVPLEYGFAYRRFLRAFAPKYGLVMEIEIWPRMIMACRAQGTPLYLCNAQYPQKSYEKDRSGRAFRAQLMGGLAGGFVKTEDQRKRFASTGMSNLHVTGELRFDQPIPQAQLDAAIALHSDLAGGRPVITLTSVVEGEDAVYIDMIRQCRGILFIYVPRAPERFETVAGMLDAAGLRFTRRSTLLDAQLRLTGPAPQIDVLLGDSMGEMYFYLGLCDRAIVGGGFTSKGAHNIIEPLALKKPVIVGPQIWTIAYPAVEAIAAGVCSHVQTEAELLKIVQHPPEITEALIDRFYTEHAGGVKRTLEVIDRVIAPAAIRQRPADPQPSP